MNIVELFTYYTCTSLTESVDNVTMIHYLYNLLTAFPRILTPFLQTFYGSTTRRMLSFDNNQKRSENDQCDNAIMRQMVKTYCCRIVTLWLILTLSACCFVRTSARQCKRLYSIDLQNKSKFTDSSGADKSSEVKIHSSTIQSILKSDFRNISKDITQITCTLN